MCYTVALTHAAFCDLGNTEAAGVPDFGTEHRISETRLSLLYFVNSSQQLRRRADYSHSEGARWPRAMTPRIYKTKAYRYAMIAMAPTDRPDQTGLIAAP
ncbi:hypothetical protein GCM10023209_13610 [Roseibacterium beibuensis]|uniref:Uncharacterized protein n=1 Tax=[Roseibacterium] beibuensis TaxID=1193142 RepID=A0ABP9L6F5_9RHOB